MGLPPKVISTFPAFVEWYTEPHPGICVDAEQQIIHVYEKTSVHELYLYLTDMCDDNLWMETPMMAITEQAYEMTNGWLISDSSFEFLHGGSIQNGEDLYIGVVGIWMTGGDHTPTGIQQNDGPVVPTNVKGDTIKLEPNTTELNFVNLRLNQRYHKVDYIPNSGVLVYPARDCWDPYPMEDTLDFVLDAQANRVEQLGKV